MTVKRRFVVKRFDTRGCLRVTTTDDRASADRIADEEERIGRLPRADGTGAMDTVALVYPVIQVWDRGTLVSEQPAQAPTAQ
jgi:hypothetical protein